MKKLSVTKLIHVLLDLRGIKRHEKLEINVVTRTTLIRPLCQKYDLTDWGIVQRVQKRLQKRIEKPFVTSLITNFFIVVDINFSDLKRLQSMLEHCTTFVSLENNQNMTVCPRMALTVS